MVEKKSEQEKAAEVQAMELEEQDLDAAVGGAVRTTSRTANPCEGGE